ncbi:MAG: rhamnan synthesis F family protein [Paracoccaceae bacterium]
MNTIPLWKVKRELARVLKQLFWKWPSLIIPFLFNRLYYDLVLARNIVVAEGEQLITPKIAIYLIFPVKGVLKSHVRALEYMIENGYAPVVVSNITLQFEDRQLLKKKCWKLIERPNFGYDFGGYRDGFLHIKKYLKDIDRLVLLNDSVWFPLPGSKNWLQSVEELAVDYAGAVSNYGIDRHPQHRFQDINWIYSTSHNNFHYCSFALAISPSVFRSKSFERFWRKFRLTNDKTRTVRRGEIGLSKWVISRGFTHAQTFDIQNIDRELSDLPEAELREVLLNLIIPEDPALSAIKSELLAASTSVDRTTVEKFILTVIARQGAGYVMSMFAIQRMGFAFLKKSPVWLNRDASNITVEIAKQLKGKFGGEILSEIQALRAERKIKQGAVG